MEIEIVLDEPCPVPPITSELGRYWDQPSAVAMIFDETHVLMTSLAFGALKEYSATNPSGVYEGKMWRRHDGHYDERFRNKGGRPEWLLCWYGPSEKGPDYCRTFFRKILLSDGELPTR